MNLRGTLTVTVFAVFLALTFQPGMKSSFFLLLETIFLIESRIKILKCLNEPTFKIFFDFSAHSLQCWTCGSVVQKWCNDPFNTTAAVGGEIGCGVLPVCVKLKGSTLLQFAICNHFYRNGSIFYIS